MLMLLMERSGCWCLSTKVGRVDTAVIQWIKVKIGDPQEGTKTITLAGTLSLEILEETPTGEYGQEENDEHFGDVHCGFWC